MRLSDNIMVPYPKEQITEAKELHNKRHSSTRMVVERVFSDLKNRWLRLSSIEADLANANSIIGACCVLHNMCINHGDITPSAATPCGNGNVTLNFTNATTKRDAIARHLILPNLG